MQITSPNGVEKYASSQKLWPKQKICRYYGHFLCILRSLLRYFVLWIHEVLGLGFYPKVIIYIPIIICNPSQNHFPPRGHYDHPYWAPFNKADKEILDKVQRRAVMIKTNISGDYEERLAILKMRTLEERRL